MFKKYLPLIGILLSAVIYLKLGYFSDRKDFADLVVLFLALFSIAFILFKSGLSTQKLVSVGIGFRLLLLLGLPVLSDDYFRFLWDGCLSLNGLNPYLYLPSDLINAETSIRGISQSLFAQLNSPEYFTIYPPVLQGVFWLGAAASPDGNLLGGVIAMRMAIILAELLTLWVMPKLLKAVGHNERNVLFYALNPLVIVELVGNLHFEALMICFVLLSLFFIHKEKIVIAAIFMALAISAKLLPLMFLPLFFFHLGWKKSFKFYLLTGLFVFITFVPFLGQAMFEHIGNSVDLYFRKFEFNASIYYVVRWVGFQTKGYNIIQTAGPKLSLITIGFIFILSINQQNSFKNLMAKLLFALSVYLFLATIVHPWYVTGVLAFAIFTRFRFALVWSFAALFSYAAYMSESYQENLWLVAVEYTAVYSWLAYEIVKNYEIGKKLKRVRRI